MTVEGCYVLGVEVLLDSSGVAGAILDVPSRADVQAEEVAAQFACLHAELLGVSPKSRPVAEFVDRMVAMLRTLPPDVADLSSVDEMIKDTLMVVRASEAGRCQLVEAFRLMSDVFRLCDTTAASVYEEVKRCTTATDIAKTRLSKSVQLQQDVLLLKNVVIIDACFDGCHYWAGPGADGDSTPTWRACPCNMQRLLAAVPGWYALAELQDQVVGALSLAFEDITTSISLAALRIQPSAGQGDVPSPLLLEACMDCKAGHAKAVDVVLQRAWGDDAWPGDALVDLACAILQMLAQHTWTVGVAPMCSGGAGETTVENLPALEEALRLFQLVGKIGRLLAWLKINFFPVRSAPVAKEGVINANLSTVLKMTGNYLKDAGRMAEDGPSLAVSSLEAIPWLFPVGQFALWVASAQTAHRQVSCDVMAAAVEQLHASSLSLHEMVPPFEALFADGKQVDLKLAARTLVDWPRKSALGKGCSALEKAITAASISHFECGV